MQKAQCVILAAALTLAAQTSLLAGKVPLQPDELLTESKLIVEGRVESHRDEEHAAEDGSRTKSVFLKVVVESVVKGEKLARPGETIETAFWVVVKEPRRGVVWDAGHWGIPADGGRARLYLDGQSGNAWNVIYPNGFERMDETPPLAYAMEPADKPLVPDWLMWPAITAAIGLAGGGAFWWMVSGSKRRITGKLEP